MLSEADGDRAPTTAARAGRKLVGMAGLVVWRSPEELAPVDGEGSVHVSENGTSWSQVGGIGGEPAAFESEPDGLYAALHDGTIKYSKDGGASWDVRLSP